MHLRNKTTLIAILGLHFILAGIYWHLTPTGIPPDEGAHLGYVESLVSEHELPVFTKDSSTYEAHQPPLYYVLAMPFYPSSVRLISVILGALSILVIYQAVRSAFCDENLALGAAGFAAFLPTHVMLSSMVSNDILAELVFCLALLLMTIRRWPHDMLALGVVLGLGMLTKTTCLLLFPAAIVAFALLRRRSVVHLMAAIALALSVGGWWLMRNQILYGDFLAMRQFVEAFQHTAKPEYWQQHGFSGPMYWLLVAMWTFASFWGVFGHMNLFMPTWVYICLGLATAAVKIGWFKGSRTFPERRIILLYCAVLLMVVLSFIGFNTKFFQAQGRYLYPAILPLAMGWALGIKSLLPKRIHSWTPYLAAAIPLAAQIPAIITLGGM